jgi:hypothetical protein
MRKTTLVPFTALLLAAACTSPPDDPASRALPPEQQLAQVAAVPPGAGFIESIDYAGTGCEGSAVTAISGDKQAATSIFDAFVAAAGGGSKPDEASRNCLMTVQINVPPGMSYSLESVDYRGFAGLDKDVTATRQSVYVISGADVHVTPQARFKGPISDDYNHGDVGPEAPGPWSPCGGGQVLWIATQTEVALNGHQRRGGQLTVDTIDTELQWKRCD